MIAPTQIEGTEVWDELLRSLAERGEGAAPHVLQSWTWGEVKSRWGWNVDRLAFMSNGRPDATASENATGAATFPVATTSAVAIAPTTSAAAQLMSRRIGRTPIRVGYVPKGPVVPSLDPAEWSGVLEMIERWAISRRLAFVKIDPDVPADASSLLAAWRERGWRPSEEQIQFKNTLRSDLSPGPTTLLSGMHSKTRYNIRLAERRGVKVRAAGHAGIETALKLYQGTAARQGFAIRAPDYYRDAWESWIDSGLAEVLIAELDGEALAAVVPVRFGDTAWYLYGASSDSFRGVMAPYAAMWSALVWAMELGCKTFDWWGGPDALEPADPMWGVYRFKQGFGARFDAQAGAWDFISNAPTYALYRGAVRARSFARRTTR